MDSPDYPMTEKIAGSDLVFKIHDNHAKVQRVDGAGCYCIAEGVQEEQDWSQSRILSMLSKIVQRFSELALVVTAWRRWLSLPLSCAWHDHRNF